MRAGHVAQTPLGLPLALSGGFALTYSVQTGSKKFAVRCFHRQVPEAQARYAAISATLRTLGNTRFVNFDFQPRGIRVKGAWFPIVKMDWADGEILGSYLDRNAQNRDAMARLRQEFVNLAGLLHTRGIAHGDIQNENVVITNGTARLIDYDGMFVPGMQPGRGSEVGHRHFQHPRRSPSEFGPSMDRFSFIVLDVSLEALQIDGSLHQNFREGGNAILFTANDFADPASSKVFQILKTMPAVQNSAKKLEAVCMAPISEVPSLDDFIVGRNIPALRSQAPVNLTVVPLARSYIGAYTVVDASDFNAVMARVGDKVELVGQIVSVFAGVGRRGKGRGKPYVFVNFGKWNQSSVKISIWSEGLSAMNTRPTKAWEGQWISVTGLVEPPYQGKTYGKEYRNVGVTVTSDSQIIRLNEADARFRLGQQGRPQAQPRNVGTTLTNVEILRSATGARTEPSPLSTARVSTTPMPTPRPSQPPRTKNEQILRSLTHQPTHSSVGVPSSSYSSPPANHRSQQFRIPPLLIWVVGFMVFIGLMRIMRGR